MGQDRNNNVVYEGHQHTETESFDR
jgi:hypothetical protein